MPRKKKPAEEAPASQDDGGLDVSELPAPERDASAKVFARIAERSKSFRPAREVLRRVRAVPSIFPDVDRQSQVAGWPIDRVAMLHGPSSHGKTQFCLGLGRSFLRRGHMFCHVDAELTTPIDFAEMLLTPELAASPRFLASRPRSYEQAVDDVRKLATEFAEARARGELPEQTTALFVVDSIQRLQPEDLIERVKRMGAEGEKGSVDGFGGGAGRMKAALNEAWLSMLVPLMYETGCGIILITREADDANASAQDRLYGRDWKTVGGKSLFFDSSMVVRIVRERFVYEGADDSKEVVGERHKVVFRKTKVAGMQEREDEAFFHTSNGKISPQGFDRARDLLELGKELGVLKTAGAWVSFERKRWQGAGQFVRNADAAALDGIEQACRATFTQDARKRADVIGEERPA